MIPNTTVRRISGIDRAHHGRDGFRPGRGFQGQQMLHEFGNNIIRIHDLLQAQAQHVRRKVVAVPPLLPMLFTIAWR